MTTPQSDELLKAFREWTDTEEEVWIELYSEFCTMLIGARMNPDSPDNMIRREYQERFDAGKEDILMAAELADAAVEEMQVRFSVQQQQRNRQRGKAKAQYQARRGKRLEARK